jgi:hypothetical protein
VSRRYDWSRFRRYLEPGAVANAVDPDEEPTVRIAREPDAVTVKRPATRSTAELEAELALHAEAGR